MIRPNNNQCADCVALQHQKKTISGSAPPRRKPNGDWEVTVLVVVVMEVPKLDCISAEHAEAYAADVLRDLGPVKVSVGGVPLEVLGAA